MKTLTEDQSVIFQKLFNMISMNTMLKHNGHPSRQIKHVVCGYAGTGKSLLIEAVVKHLSKAGINGQVVSLTGRAAYNLSRKGLNAKTAHSVLKVPVTDEYGNIKYFRTREKHEIEDTIGNYIIIEEASMMPSELLLEIAELVNVPIIMVGDDAQLDPVKDISAFQMIVEDHPLMDGVHIDFLSEIKRTDEQPILKIATALRTEGEFPSIHVTEKDVANIHAMRKSDLINRFLPAHNEEYDVICTLANKMRRDINDAVRAARGFTSDIPQVGETLVCLRNSPTRDGSHISNGERFIVKNVWPGDSDDISRKIKHTHMYELCRDYEDLNGPTSSIKVIVDDNMFIDEELSEENKTQKFDQNQLQYMTYGYCMTVHKLQGVGMPRVLYVDQDLSKFVNVDMAKVRYTAVTRAEERLTVVRL